MVITNTLLGGTNLLQTSTQFAKDENDTNNALIGYGSNINPSLPPIGSVLLYPKLWYYNILEPWESIAGYEQTNGTGYIVAFEITSFPFLDFIKFQQSMNASSSGVSQCYVLITYTDETTYTSDTYNAVAIQDRLIKNPNSLKEISKVEIFHRRSGGNSSQYSTIQNVNCKFYHFDNFLGNLTGDTCWVECDGQTLDDEDSPYHGIAIPNLNGPADTGTRGYFLRGYGTSGIIEVSQNLAHTHTKRSGNRINTSSTAGGGSSSTTTSTEGDIEARPHNYAGTWIMRVK